MAEANSVTRPSKPQSPKEQQNPSKPISSFLYKVILVSILIALLPIFPSSQSLELSNKSILARSWELLRLLLVGIAVSYGLFSRRNSDPDTQKEKADTPQSYVSQILQVSSVFDDEEVISPKGLDFTDETKNQTWNYSQYYRKEPVVMVAEETTSSTNISTKPLLFPVRSLKSKPLHPESFDSGYKLDSSSVASDETDEDGKIGGKEAAVLPSPIPWRSRSSPSPSISPEVKGKINEDFRRKKSFNKSSPPPPPPPPPPSHAYHFISEKRVAGKSLKDELEDLSRRGRRDGLLHSNAVGSDSFNSEKVSYVARSVKTVRPKEGQRLPPLPKNRRKKKDEFMERMIISASDSESELSDAEDTLSSVPTEAETEENEVDKKADEFIAKFREQIRLQRIASIKRSSGQRNTRNSN